MELDRTIEGGLEGVIGIEPSRESPILYARLFMADPTTCVIRGHQGLLRRVA